MFEEDYAFTYSLLESFFNQRRIQNTLYAIDERSISGWEKWWQIEFALFLGDHDEISEWNMEEVFYTDLRKEKIKDKIAIDICFRRKGYAKDKLIFLELKQDIDPHRCFANMFKDIEKVYKAQTKSHSDAVIRNFFTVGVHPSLRKADVKDYIFDKAENYDEFDINLVESKFIPNTNFSFTMF